MDTRRSTRTLSKSQAASDDATLGLLLRLALTVWATLVLLVLVSSCGGATADPSSPPEVEGPGSGGGSGGGPGIEGDLCGNEPGNGYTLISGPSGPSGADFDQAFRSLTVHPTDPQILYLGTERNGIVKSVDGGVSWARIRRGMRHMNGGYPEVWDIAISPADPNLVVAATLDSPGPVKGDYPSSIGGVYRSVDGGETWARSNCGLSNSRAVSILFHPATPNLVLLGVEGGEASFSGLEGQFFSGGLMRSVDGGVNWQAASAPSGAGTNGYWILRGYDGPSSGVVSFGFDYGAPDENVGFLRTEVGEDWIPFAPELRTGLLTAWDVSSDGQVLYGNRRDSFEMLRSRDAGMTWDTVASPANGLVRIHPDDSETLLFEANGQLFRSDDGLASYSPVFEAPSRINDVEFAPSDPTVVYAAAEGYHVYRSADGGLTWALVASLRGSVLPGS